MEYIDFKKDAQDLMGQISEVRRLMDQASRESELAELEAEMNKADFWNDQNRAKKISKRLAQLRDELDHIRKLESSRHISTFWMRISPIVFLQKRLTRCLGFVALQKRQKLNVY